MLAKGKQLPRPAGYGYHPERFSPIQLNREVGPVPRPSRPVALPQFLSISILAPCYVIRIHDNEMQKNTIRPKDFILAHAFASLTTSSAFGETSVSILTPAPDSLDKFLQYTDTGSYWRVYGLVAAGTLCG